MSDSTVRNADAMARQTIQDALCDSNYRAGVTAGWNAANSDDPEAKLAQLQASRSGHLAGFKDAKAILAALSPADGDAGVEVEYEVWQKDAFGDGDGMVAGSTSLADARHYAAVYSQDAPAWVVEVSRRALTPTGTGEQGK